MRVGLFITCLADSMRPGVAFAAMKLLQGTSFDLVIPGSQTCCGLSGWQSGDIPAARKLALKFLQEFADCDYVVIPSESCANMIRNEFPGLFADQPMQRAMFEQIASRTHELTDFLVNVAKIETVPGEFDGAVVYLDRCENLDDSRLRQQPRKLLAMVKGLRLREEGTLSCDGDCGTTATSLSKGTAERAERRGVSPQRIAADAIVGNDLACLLNIEGHVRRQGDDRTRVLHVAEVLAGVA